MRSLRFVRNFWLALLLMVIPASSFAGVFVSITIAPPVLPVYVQPACPGDGYIWTPGYWAYGPEGYFWVPGTWVMPPTVGVLWTPGYWGWGDGVYLWHAGYWGPHIGFYGGVNYGYGYFGNGYEGGYWRDRHFYYNRTVNNVTITNVHIYNKTVINNVTVNRVSYNGGHGGIEARASREQEMAEREHHFEMTDRQRDHEHGAAGDRGFLASENHGRPSVAATPRPGEFSGPRVMPAGTSRSPFARPTVRPIPRPQEPVRRDDRSIPHPDARGNRGPSPDYNARRDAAPRPGNYRPENASPRGNEGPHGNAGPHSAPQPRMNENPHGNEAPHNNAPHQERENHSDRGRDERR
jgi:hypothetical protein